MLRARGHRLTPQRQLVLEAVQPRVHATREEILAKVRQTVGAVNISTVYRTLELLEELGLISHAHLGHGPPTYHHTDQEAHLHLVCRDCRSVIETEVAVAADLVAKLDHDYGFDTDVRHFAIFGRCSDCRKQRAAHRTPFSAPAHPPSL